MIKYVALLRGVNVGGKNPLAMADLKACLEALGCTQVRTYINSGNAVFASSKKAAALTAEIQDALAAFSAPDAPIKALVLSHEQLWQVLAEAPEGFGSQPELYHSDAIFLMGIAPEDAFAVFRPREGVDRIWLGGLAVYSQRLSAERTKSRLSAIMASPLYKSMTIRTWNTVRKLQQMLETME